MTDEVLGGDGGKKAAALSAALSAVDGRCVGCGLYICRPRGGERTAMTSITYRCDHAEPTLVIKISPRDRKLGAVTLGRMRKEE